MLGAAYIFQNIAIKSNVIILRCADTMYILITFYTDGLDTIRQGLAASEVCCHDLRRGMIQHPLIEGCFASHLQYSARLFVSSRRQIHNNLFRKCLTAYSSYTRAETAMVGRDFRKVSLFYEVWTMNQHILKLVCHYISLSTPYLI